MSPNIVPFDFFSMEAGLKSYRFRFFTRLMQPVIKGGIKIVTSLFFKPPHFAY